MRITAKTDIGNGRAENQDNYRALQYPGDLTWAVVCDGMGGAKSGQTASRIGVELLRDAAEKQLETLPEKQEKEFLLASIQGANRKIYERSLADSAMSGMGTTVVQAVVRGGVAHFAHMGDSRAYLFHHDQLQQITRDHSYVQEMVDSGKLSAEEAERHPKKNLITRAMGVSAAALAEYTACPVKSGDILLICTDGLSNTLPLQTMQDILRKTQFFDMADRLVEQALQEGAQDNITALLIGIEPTEAYGSIYRKKARWAIPDRKPDRRGRHGQCIPR